MFTQVVQIEVYIHNISKWVFEGFTIGNCYQCTKIFQEIPHYLLYRAFAIFVYTTLLECTLAGHIDNTYLLPLILNGSLWWEVSSIVNILQLPEDITTR